MRFGALAGGARQQGEAEGEGLAGSGTAAAQDVAAREGVGQGGALDREGHGHALRAEGGQQLPGHVQVGEGADRGQRGGDRLGRGELALDRGGPAAAAARTARSCGTPRGGRTESGTGGAGAGSGGAFVPACGVHSEPHLP